MGNKWTKERQARDVHTHRFATIESDLNLDNQCKRISYAPIREFYLRLAQSGKASPSLLSGIGIGKLCILSGSWRNDNLRPTVERVPTQRKRELHIISTRIECGIARHSELCGVECSVV